MLFCVNWVINLLSVVFSVSVSSFNEKPKIPCELLFNS